jgi:hypothetical protein
VLRGQRNEFSRPLISLLAKVAIGPLLWFSEIVRDEAEKNDDILIAISLSNSL